MITEQSEHSLKYLSSILIWDFDKHQLPSSKYPYAREILKRYRLTLLKKKDNNMASYDDELNKVEKYIERLNAFVDS